MMVECLVQSCAWLSRVTDSFEYSALLLQQARAVKFNSFLKPGQTLEVTATMKAADATSADFLATRARWRDSQPSVRGWYCRRRTSRARNPQLADNDARMIASMKELFEQIRGVQECIR
jgi:3-hydroxyacyl-[acyl-carrier-protein] dehydratase